MKQWYTLHTKPNAEYQVASTLQQSEIEIYLPEIKVVKMGQQGQKKPFFPCYLFMNADIATGGLSFVQWTPGLRHIVAFDNRPVPLADEVIDLIRSNLREIEAHEGCSVHNFKPGEMVRIIAGPFQDMKAIFEGPTTPNKRVQVLLTFLGHASRMQVDVTDLEKAPPAAEVPIPQRLRRTRGQGRYIKRTG